MTKENSDTSIQITPYSNEELELNSDLEEKIEKLMKFFDQVGIKYDKFNPESLPKLDFDKKKAYPNNDQYMYIPGQHNHQKWLGAVKNIYYQEKNGSNRVLAIRKATNGWNVTETFDFLNWLKYHESGDHMKYKFAQLWYENGAPGYFLHVKQDNKEPEKNVSNKDIDFAKTFVEEDINKKQLIEKQRSKIIGRLDSAEKLLRSNEGHMFAGNEFESLLESIYSLKKKIQLVNKVSTSTIIYDDMIIREANILVKKGFNKAGNLLFSVAQANNPPPAGTGTTEETPLSPTPPAPPAEPSGAPGGLPSTGPGAPTTPPDYVNENSAVGEFLENLQTNQITTKEDTQGVEDDLEVNDSLYIEEDELLVSEAQEIPPAAQEEVPFTTDPAPSPLNQVDPADIAPAPEPKKAPKDLAPDTEEPLEVTEDDIKTDTSPATSVTEVDNKINEVFSNITIGDVVVKLEDLAKIFKNREIPRQLNIVDMMLDSLGLASFFPSLSEATNKALESNNYISTRVEDILSKLRGTLASNKIDLQGESPEKPEVAGIKNKLKSDEDKEKARKQMRKEQEATDLESKNKETPDVEIQEDLAPPTKEAPPPIPAPIGR